MQFLFGLILSLVSVFLILLVLVQRGRGGGLTGALGGMGGQSAFGTKAGDTFTKITVISATVWILLAILAVKFLGGSSGPLGDAQLGTANAATSTDTGGASAASGGTAAGNALDNLPAAGNSGTAAPGGTSGNAEAEPSSE